MANPPITRFTSLAVSTAQNSGNPNNGLYAPELTQDQIELIPTDTKKNGGLWYNKDTKNLEAVVNNKVEIVQVGPSGQGDVVGPNASAKGNIAIFDDTTGKLIADSGVDIIQVPSPLSFLISSDPLENINVNEIGNLGHVKFTNDVGLIFVDSLMPVEFITNSFGGDEQVCSLFTGGLPSSSTSPSALVELQSDTGALLLSRMTTTERNALSAPSGANGMLLFNSTSKTFDGFDGTNWRVLPQLNTDGTLTAADPAVSANLATKNYVDTAIAVPAAVKFIVQVANASVPNAQELGALTTGLLKNTTTTGVLSTAIAGTDYYSLNNPTRIIDTGLTGTPSNNFFIGTNAGNLTLTLSPNTGVGINTLASLTTGHSNVSVGYNSQTTITSGTFNTSVGRESLFLNVIGFSNSAFGSRSLYNNTASYNTAFGANALYFNTTGTPNSAFGTDALTSNTTGINNNAVGYQALNLNTTGGNNNAFGVSALYSNTTGTLNNAFGYQTLYSNTIGANNNAVGYQALYSNVTGSQNTAFGNLSLQLSTGSFNCAFGYRSLAVNTADGNCAFGTQSLALSTTGIQNTAFGTQSLAINITGIQNAAFGYTSLFLNLGSNNAAFGYQALYSNSVSNNSAFGSNALYSNTTGAQNSAFATDALLNNTTGNNSSAFGYQSLYSNTTGSNNAFGYIALRSNTTGSGNNAFGSGALYSNQTGNSNSAFGPGALYSNVSALGNCGFGFQALYNNNATGNSAFGFNALFSNTGGGNSAFGNNALYTNTTGINNVAFGTTAGATQLIYNNSVFIGYEADASVNNLSNAIAIGYQASVGASNCMVLGGSGGNQLSVGIGITPNAQLQLPTIHANRKIVLYETANNDHQVFGLGTAAGFFRFQVDNTASSYIWNAAASSSTSTELMRLTGTGYLGIGTSAPHAELQLGNTVTNRKVVLYESVNNDHQFYGFGINTSILRYQITASTDNHVWYAGASSSTSTELMRLTGTGRLGIGTNGPDQLLTVNSSTPSKITSGSWAAFSDGRMKDVLGEYKQGLAEIIQIKPKKFKYNDKSDYPEHEKAKTNIGIIAQEIEGIFPECIVGKIQKGDISDMRLFDGTALTYALINAVKELNNEIIILKQQNNN